MFKASLSYDDLYDNQEVFRLKKHCNSKRACRTNSTITQILEIGQCASFAIAIAITIIKIPIVSL